MLTDQDARIEMQDFLVNDPRLTLQSLVPETQNLYFDAVNNPVFSTQE